MTALLGSVTVPSTSPVVFWAAENDTNTTEEMARIAMSFTSPEPIDVLLEPGLTAGLRVFHD